MVTPVHKHWSYHSLAPSHWNMFIPHTESCFHTAKTFCRSLGGVRYVNILPESIIDLFRLQRRPSTCPLRYHGTSYCFCLSTSLISSGDHYLPWTRNWVMDQKLVHGSQIGSHHHKEGHGPILLMFFLCLYLTTNVMVLPCKFWSC